MTKKIVFVSLVLFALAAMPALAAEGGGDAGAHTYKIAFAALGLGIAAAGGALAQGRAAGEALGGMARNPGAAGRIQTAMLIALAFMESLVIFVFAMTYLLSQG
ncbi:MAG TPA: ATP synthase F0 subunit C [Thermoanaerobaculia bacterium]|nr:ATP synthase F0 subunit C [Thermoanaerobaculia bacterium]